MIAAPRWFGRGPLLLAVALACPIALAGCAGNAASASRADPAQQLLQRLALPTGTVPLDTSGGAPTSFQSDESGCMASEREAYWRVPGLSIDAAQQWFEQHVPGGLRGSGSGSGGGPDGETMTEVDYSVIGGSARPADGSRLVVEAVADGAGSAIRASAQIAPAGGCGSAPHFGGLHGAAVTVRPSL